MDISVRNKVWSQNEKNRNFGHQNESRKFWTFISFLLPKLSIFEKQMLKFQFAIKLFTEMFFLWKWIFSFLINILQKIWQSTTEALKEQLTKNADNSVF